MLVPAALPEVAAATVILTEDAAEAMGAAAEPRGFYVTFCESLRISWKYRMRLGKPMEKKLEWKKFLRTRCAEAAEVEAAATAVATAAGAAATKPF